MLWVLVLYTHLWGNHEQSVFMIAEHFNSQAACLQALAFYKRTHGETTVGLCMEDKPK